MKLKKVLSTSLLCAVVCSSLIGTKISAEESQEHLEVQTTSIEKLNKEMFGKKNKLTSDFIPTISFLGSIFEESEFSLVTEEDAMLPEGMSLNVFYTNEDIELKTSSEEESDVVTIIPKGTAVEIEVVGDTFASIKFEDKTGVVETASLSAEKVEPEKTEEVEDIKVEEIQTTDIKEPEIEEPKVVEEVQEEPVQETPKYETVTMYATDVLNVRSDASTSSSRLGSLNVGDEVYGSDLGEWIEFSFNGSNAYVMKSYLSTEKPVVQETKQEEVVEETPQAEVPSSSDTSSVETVVQSALAQVGKPYVWAASNPNVGFDCSGLMVYSFKQVGVYLNRIAADQYYNGTPVSRDQLQRGDLVFFSYGGYIGHVGLYIGGGQFVHASDYSTGVIISNLSGYYLNTYAGAVRVIK